MIHWGTEIPNQRPSMPDFGNELLIKPKTSNVYFASNPRIAKSLGTSLNKISPAASGSQEQINGNDILVNSVSEDKKINLIGSPWYDKYETIHSPGIDKDIVDNAHNNFTDLQKTALFRQRSRSCEEIRLHSKRRDNHLNLSLTAPKEVLRGEQFGVYLTISNKCPLQANVAVVLRVDIGRKKLKTLKQNLVVGGKTDPEVSIMLPSTDFWHLVSNSDKNFAVIATAHIQDSGQILSKIDHIKITNPKYFFFRRPQRLLKFRKSHSE